jgi:hypothetical protein
MATPRLTAAHRRAALQGRIAPLGGIAPRNVIGMPRNASAPPDGNSWQPNESEA